MALNLGGITFGLAADVTGLDRAASTLQAFGNRVTAVMQAAKRGADTNIQELMRQEQAAVRTLQQVQDKIAAIGRMNISPTVRTDQIDRLREAAEGFTRIMAGKLDSLQFQRAGLGIRELLQDVDRAIAAEKSTADTASNAVAAAFERQRLAIIRAEYQIDLYIDKLERAQRAGQISGGEASGLRIQAFNALQAHNAQVEPGATPLNAEAMLRANQSLRTSMTGLNRDFSALVQHQSFAASGFKALGNAATLSMGPLSGVSFRVQALNQLITDHGVLLGVGAAAVIGFATALFGLAQSVVHVSIEMQRTQMALQGITNSSAIASAEISVLRDAANQAGLRFSEIAPAFSRFVSSATGAGQSLNTTNQEMRQFAALAGVLHLSTDEVNNSFRAFDQMLSAGRVQGQEIRQLFNNLPAVMEIATQAAQHLGVNLRDSMRHGTLGSQAFVREFMNVATTMFHIDLTHPLDTLQAAINRSKNSWDLMLIEIDHAVNISGLAKTGFNGLAAAMQWVTTNIRVIIQDLIQFAGVLAGAAAGFATWATMTVIITGIGAAVTAVTAAYRALAGTIEVVTALTAILNAVSSANVWIAIGQAIFTVIGALVGFRVAQDLARQAIQSNDNAMIDSAQGGIETYIRQQEHLLTATNDATDAMIRQQRVQAAQAHQGLDAATERYNRAQQQYYAALDRSAASRAYVGSNQDPMGAGLGAGIADHNLAEASRSYLSATTAFNEAVNRDLRVQDNMRALERIARAQTNLLDTPANARVPGTGNQHHADPMAGLRSLQDIIVKATEAQNALDNMWRGPANTSMYQALAKANEAVNQLDASHRELLAHMLQAAGFEVGALGGVSGAVFVLTARTQLATEMAQRFGAAWTTIHDAVVNIADLNTQLDWLRHGGNPEDMWVVEALQRTQNLINELTGESGSGGLPALQRALQGMVDAGAINAAQMQTVMDAGNTDNAAGLHALVDLLHSLNYGLTTTGTDAEIAAAGLNELFNAGGRLNQQLRVSTQILGDVRTRFREWANLQGQVTLGQNHGNIRQFRELEALQASTEFFRRLRELGDTQTIDAITAMLNEQGFTVGTLEQRYAAFNMVVDDTQRSLDSYRQGLEQTQQSWTNFTNSTLDSIESLIMGTQSLSDTIKAILMDLARTILETTLFDPIKRQLTNLIQGIPSSFGAVGGGGGGIWGTIMGLFSGGGGGGGGADLGGLWADLAKSMFLGFADGTPSAPGGWSIVGEKGPELMNVPKGAQIYPHGTGPASGGGVYVNASTSVVVQGNLTPDAMEELKQVLMSREARLRAELPYLIDGRVQDSVARGRYG